jgi:tetratricopeptide (TPR) repeat protein
VTAPARAASARAVEAALASGGGIEILFRRALLLRENDAWGEALDAFEDFLGRAERAADTSGVFLALRELSTLHRALGRPERALDFAQRALEIAQKAGEPTVIGDARAAVAMSRLMVERRRGPVAPDAAWLREAVVEARRAIAGYVAASMERGADGVRLALARLLVASDDRAGALETLRALAARPGVDVERSEIGGLLRAVEAEVDAAAGRWRKAAEAARRSLELRRGLARGLGESDALGSREDAESTAALGVTACAAWAAATPSEAAEAAAVAFGCVEDSRGVLLAEGLTNRSALLWRDADPQLVERDHATRAAVAAARARLLDAKGDAATAARAALDAAWKDREDAVARLQRAAARTAAFVDPPRPDAKATAGCLTQEDAVVVYRTTGGAAGHAVVVRHDGARLVALGPLAALDAAIKAWRRVVATDSGDDRAAAKAYDVLVRPLDAALAGATRLVFVPDGALVPAVRGAPARGRRAERTARRARRGDVRPSAGLLDVLGTEAASQAAAPTCSRSAPDAAGRDRVPGPAGRRRGGPVAANRFAPGHATLLVGSGRAPTRSRGARRRRTPVPRRHLACHGLVDPDRPSGSGLLLAGGKVLDVDRIQRERWRADLVVLSACESGRGRVVLGEGVFGLVRAALLAGVPRVVTSQWVVSDRATRRFMDRFYDAHLGRGLSAASALTDASGGPPPAAGRLAVALGRVRALGRALTGSDAPDVGGGPPAVRRVAQTSAALLNRRLVALVLPARPLERRPNSGSTRPQDQVRQRVVEHLAPLGVELRRERVEHVEPPSPDPSLDPLVRAREVVEHHDPAGPHEREQVVHHVRRVHVLRDVTRHHRVERCAVGHVDLRRVAEPPLDPRRVVGEPPLRDLLVVVREVHADQPRLRAVVEDHPRQDPGAARQLEDVLRVLRHLREQRLLPALVEPERRPPHDAVVRLPRAGEEALRERLAGELGRGRRGGHGGRRHGAGLCPGPRARPPANRREAPPAVRLRRHRGPRRRADASATRGRTTPSW